MKPNFALALSSDGIRLLRRSVGGWRIVGEVSPQTENLAEELATLRKTATALEPGGLRTKLLIPNDQIKFLTISTPGISDAARRRQAEIALEGATPYDVSDLVFDICPDRAQTHVAAVARETLAEAEAFAMEHRFHPVSFVAQPDNGSFDGEAYFGTTKSVASWLEEGQTLERDSEAVTILGDVIHPTRKAEPKQDDARVPAPEPDKATAPAAASPKPDASGPRSPTPDPENKPDKQKPVVAPKITRTSSQKPAPLPIAGQRPVSAPVTTPDTKKAAPAVTPAATPIDTKPADGARKPLPATTPVAPAAFSSRRGASPALGSASRTATTETGPVPDSSSLKVTPPIADAKPARLGFLTRRKPRKVPPEVQAKPMMPALPVSGSGSGSGKSKAALEADKMTVFGARADQSIRGKPRFLGLLLTAALLLFLAGVAAWASVFLDDGISLSRLFGTRAAPVVASEPTSPPNVALPVASAAPEVPAVTAPAPAPAPVSAPAAVSAPPTATEATEVAALDPVLTDEDGAVLDALKVPELPQPRDLSLQQSEARYAVTGIWPGPPNIPTAPPMISLEDLYLTSIDPVSTTSDAIALPPVALLARDVADISTASPAVAGTLFALDNRGLVVPSRQGALNPDGILVYAGRPAVVPPQTIVRPQVAVVEESPVISALVGSRPKPRPADLSEQNERANLGGLTRLELTKKRPVLRPASIKQTATVASQAAADAAAEAVIAALKAAEAASPIKNATAYAVSASTRPDLRPRNFERIVRRAQRDTPKPKVVASTAAVAPRVVAPSPPSKTSVAKQATVKNAIKLRQINLIGVYGKPSSRRALIRLSNGRYQKVAVGDRLDGGRVSAIGDSELRYTRRGRDVVLKMPRG